MLDHRVRTEQKIEGTRGTVAVNMATGTIISTPTGDLIDPASIGIRSAIPADRIKADAYHTKNAKPIKTKK